MLSVFGRRIKGMVTAGAGVDVQRDTSQPSALFSFSLKRNIYVYETAASCKDIAQATVTNGEPECVTLAGYCWVGTHL